MDLYYLVLHNFLKLQFHHRYYIIHILYNILKCGNESNLILMKYFMGGQVTHTHNTVADGVNFKFMNFREQVKADKNGKILI